MNKIKNALMFLLAKIMTTFAAAPSYLAFTGAGSSRQLAAHIRRSGFKRLLIVTDKPLRDLGLVDRVVSAFDGSDIDIAIYDGVLPNPTYDQVNEGVAILKQQDSQAILAIGGGSPIDCAKIISACATSDEDPKNWIGFGKVKHELLPLFAIPTTAGTGSEATQGAVISDSETHEKGVLSGEHMLVAATALDPEMQLGLPAHITAATGMDALTHAIEAYICRWERGTSKQNAERAVRLVFESLKKAYDHGEDMDARETMILAAYYAGIAINQVNVGTVHAIAHQLGGKYGIPHGLANALVLPHILDFHKEKAIPQLAELAVLIGIDAAGKSQADLAQAFIDAVVELRASVGIPETSEQIKSEDFDYLIDLAVNEAAGYFAPRLLTRDGARDVLTKISAAA